jgi:hypothetical protein
VDWLVDRVENWVKLGETPESDKAVIRLLQRTMQDMVSILPNQPPRFPNKFLTRIIWKAMKYRMIQPEK